MPFNGSGVFQRVRNWMADATAGIKIRADYHDAEDDGFATGLTNCITRDGQTIVTENIPFNSKRITALADPVNAQDASTKAYTDTRVANPGTVTGDINITKDAPTIVLNSTAAGGSSGIQGTRNGVIRWLLRLGNGEAESGSNVGSNFDIHRYDDAGGYLGPALTINRASGAWSVNTSMTVGTTAVINSTLHVGAGGAAGLIYLGNSGQRHLHFDGTRYALAGAPTYVEAPQVGTDAANKNYVDGRTSFTPVQQDGGAGMVGNKIYIGWTGAGLALQVDNSPQGLFAMQSQLVSGATTGRRVHNGDVSSASYPHLVWAESSNSVISAFASSWQASYPIPALFRFKYTQLFVNGGWVTITG